MKVVKDFAAIETLLGALITGDEAALNTVGSHRRILRIGFSQRQQAWP